MGSIYKNKLDKLSQLRVAVGGCPHTPADKANGIDSITSFLSLAEQEFDPNIAMILGDFSTNQDPTELATYASEGADVSAQLNSGTKLTREKIYCCHGNHDAGDMNYDWYNRYVDDFGNNTAYSGVDNTLRPYAISGVENDYYSIETGNILWLFLNDRNEGAQPCGRSGGSGGFPSGSISLAAFNWWKTMVEANSTKIIITCCHENPKDTTIATGDNDGVNGGYHGSTGQSIASGRLNNIINPDTTYDDGATALLTYLTNNNGCIDAWICAHTHVYVDETYNGLSQIATVYGINFINIGGLTKYHSGRDPQSKFFQFIDGSNQLKIYRILNDASYSRPGFHDLWQTITLRQTFTL